MSLAAEDSRYRASTLRSSFTKQPLSNMKSAPGYGFGTSNRDAHSKTFTSGAADKSNLRSRGGNNSQGPCYSPNLSTFGKQSLSVAASASVTHFGTSDRGRRYDNGTPGPGAYNELSTIGGAPVSNVRSAPKNSFGNATRDRASKAFISTRHEKSQFAGAATPGPGTYQTSTTLGKNAESKRKNEPSWK